MNSPEVRKDIYFVLGLLLVLALLAWASLPTLIA
jgi:hypothetical protein